MYKYPLISLQFSLSDQVSKLSPSSELPRTLVFIFLCLQVRFSKEIEGKFVGEQGRVLVSRWAARLSQMFAQLARIVGLPWLPNPINRASSPTSRFGIRRKERVPHGTPDMPVGNERESAQFKPQTLRRRRLEALRPCLVSPSEFF